MESPETRWQKLGKKRRPYDLFLSRLLYVEIVEGSKGNRQREQSPANLSWNELTSGAAILQWRYTKPDLEAKVGIPGAN